jgi:hypothetical protein
LSARHAADGADRPPIRGLPSEPITPSIREMALLSWKGSGGGQIQSELRSNAPKSLCYAFVWSPGNQPGDRLCGEAVRKYRRGKRGFRHSQVVTQDAFQYGA